MANIIEGGTAEYKGIFNPNAIAVYGASRSKRKMGHKVLEILQEHGFPKEAIVPVNPNASEVAGLRAIPSLSGRDKHIDLALIAVPVDKVHEAFRDAIEHGVSGAIIVTSGFSESGPSGAGLERELRAMSIEADVPFVGPNCEGVINNHSDLYAMISGAMFQQRAPVGGVSVVSQSGAYTGIVYHALSLQNVGLSKVISVGNEGGLSVVDCMEYLLADPETEVVALHLEGIRNVSRFREVATRLSRQKRLIINQVGRSVPGGGVAATHTGTLAGGGRAVRSLYMDVGAYVTRTTEAFVDSLCSAATIDSRNGNRVGVVSFSGGIRVEAVDLLDEAGFLVPALEPRSQKAIQACVPSHGSPQNPVDMADGLLRDPSCAARCVSAMSEDGGIDVIVVLLTVTQDARTASSIVAAADATEKPVYICCTAPDASYDALEVFRDRGYPVYETLWRLTNALASTPSTAFESAIPEPMDAKDDAATTASASGGPFMGFGESFEVLRSAGLGVAPYVHVPLLSAVTEEQLVNVAPPYAVKCDLPEVAHKSAAGLVRLNCASLDELNMAIAELAHVVESQYPRDICQGLLVQGMVKTEAPEFLVGFHRDPVVGPVAVVGVGGTLTELVDDVHVVVLPSTKTKVASAIQRLRITRAPVYRRHISDGVLDQLVEFVMLGSEWFEDSSDIASVDINPVLLDDTVPLAVDVVIRRSGSPE